jgi:hypothetical protein
MCPNVLNQSSWDFIDFCSNIHAGVTIFPGTKDGVLCPITIEQIDRLKETPEADVVTICGLKQDTFEYFIRTYGRQFRAIKFFKNRFIEDWSLLGTLTDVQYLHFFWNQRITSFWDMSGNTALRGLAVKDFSRLMNVELVNTALNLETFWIGNEIWSRMVIDSLMPLVGSSISHLIFDGRKIVDDDLSFLDGMINLKRFDFPSNLYTTEQVAWIAANYPKLDGSYIIPYSIYDGFGSEKRVIITGKGKPSFDYKGNDERLLKCEARFNELKTRYKGIPYRVAFKTSGNE